MLRPPVPNDKIAMLENCKPQELLGFFESCIKTGPKGKVYGLLPDAWGTLFSGVYLSPVELVDEMCSEVHRLGEANEEMLRQFVKADWPNGGTFVLSVIEKGGMIDRSALIMIADPPDLAKIEYNGTTALHMLVKASDRRVRPVLITRAGKQLLSGVFDRNGIPVLLSLFLLSDLCAFDLNAISQVFTPGDLKTVMAKNRMGRNGLEIFTEISESMKGKPIRDRNAFAVNNAVKTTNPEGTVKQQINSPVYSGGIAAAQVKVVTGKNIELAGCIPSQSPVKFEPAIQIIPEQVGSSGVTGADPENNSAANASDKLVPETHESVRDCVPRQKVMIVEDDPVILKLLEVRLQKMGYEICAAVETGDESVKLALDTKPDIVLMDINLPGTLDGIEAARKIKTKAYTRIIFLTGLSDPEIVDRAKAVHPNGYILKPFSDTDLRVALSLVK
jgi:CheY-like chemotaxis protein